jgi:hypothetical protein
MILHTTSSFGTKRMGDTVLDEKIMVIKKFTDNNLRASSLYLFTLGK